MLYHMYTILGFFEVIWVFTIHKVGHNVIYVCHFCPLFPEECFNSGRRQISICIYYNKL
jgi:hypothetical protein